jgi:serine/threonine protein kinase
MSLSPGQILNNRYRIVRLLGQGGFGAIYRAWDLNMERDSPSMVTRPVMVIIAGIIRIIWRMVVLEMLF